MPFPGLFASTSGAHSLPNYRLFTIEMKREAVESLPLQKIPSSLSPIKKHTPLLIKEVIKGSIYEYSEVHKQGALGYPSTYPIPLKR